MITKNINSEWNLQFSQKIHKAKLKNIMNREYKCLSSSLETFTTSRKSEIEKSQKIYRENKLLYNHLLIISERKSSPLLLTSTSPSKTTQSRYQKLEAARINTENINLINRLAQNNSGLSLKKMLKDYKQNEEYCDMISRKNFQNRIKKAVKSTLTSKTRPKGAEQALSPSSNPNN